MALARILLYTATEGFRHDSIPYAISALQSHAAQHNIIFDATEDRTTFTEANLTKYDAVAFFLNTGEILEDDGKVAFQNYLDKGGNFLAMHSAAAALMNTTFYQKALGALFDYHPDFQPAIFTVLDADHPSTSMLPARWNVTEEVYNFLTDPRDVGAKVLLSVDETSYVDGYVSPANDGTPHPIAWYQERCAGASIKDGPVGRSWYSSLGHGNTTWQDETFLAHVFGGIKWALASNTTRAFNPNAKVGYPDNPPTPPSTETGTGTATATAVVARAPRTVADPLLPTFLAALLAATTFAGALLLY